MTPLPLYVEHPVQALDRAPALPVDPNCARCPRGAKARRRCVPADGEPGGVLVVGGVLSRTDEAAGRPLISEVGTLLRALVKAHWQGPAAFDAAVRCAGAARPATTDAEACRPFLAGVLDEARPERVLVVGSVASWSVLGRSIPGPAAARCVAFLADGTPAFVVPDPHLERGKLGRDEFAANVRWALTAPVPAGPPAAESFRVVETAEDAEAAVAEFRRADFAALDVETAGRMHEPRFRILSLAACAAGTDAAWVWGAPALRAPETSGPLRAWLEDPSAGKVGQHFSYDCLSLDLALGVKVRGVLGDARLWRKGLDADADANLNVLAERVGMGGHKEEAHRALTAALGTWHAKARAGKAWPELIPAERDDPALEAELRLVEDPKQEKFALLPKDVLWRYNARDAVATARVGVQLRAELEEQPDLARHFREVVIPGSLAVTRMERAGVAVSKERLEAFAGFLDGKLEGLRRYFESKNVNPAAPVQVARLLFDDLGLVPKTGRNFVTSTGAPTTSKAMLQDLRKRYAGRKEAVEALDALLAHRRFDKLDGTYARGMLLHVRPDGRIHPSFKVDGARSGRLSCTEPNLQNIPSPDRDPELGRMARDCFVAPPGRMLVECDYSQLEIRVAAMLSGDPEMLRILESGEDFHWATARLIAKVAWGILPEAVTKEHRAQAKTINFALLYGQEDWTLAERLGIAKEQAARIRSAILGRFTRLAAWIQERLKESRRTGDCWTWWDGRRARRRPLRDITSAKDYERGNAERSSWNTPVQGTGSDFCLASLARVQAWADEDGVDAEPVLIVHDSLLVECAEEALDEVVFAVPRIMCSWESAGVPLVADVKVGRSWGSLTKLAA